MRHKLSADPLRFLGFRTDGKDSKTFKEVRNPYWCATLSGRNAYITSLFTRRVLILHNECRWFLDGPALRKSSNGRTAAPPQVGGLHKEGTKEDPMPLKVAAPDSYCC